MARMSVSERRAKLVDAATRAMSRDGVANTTTRSIVAEADMTLGSFHYCFSSKDDLMLEVFRSINRQGFDAVSHALEGATGTAPELILRGIAAFGQHIRTTAPARLLRQELLLYAVRQEDRHQTAQQQYDASIRDTAAFLGLVSAGSGTTWNQDVDCLARWVLAVAEGITVQYLVMRDDAVLDRLFGHLADELCQKVVESDAVGVRVCS